LSGAGEAYEVFKYTFPAPEKYFTHFSGAGEVLIYTYLAPEKNLYTPNANCQSDMRINCTLF